MKRFQIKDIVLAVVFVFALGITAVPQVQAATNIIPNPSFETANGSAPANWTAYQEGTNTTFTYQTSGHTGSRSTKVQITSLSSGGFADYYFDAQNVTAGAKYDFSFWYQSNVEAEVDAEITTTSGSKTWIYIGTVPASSAWKQYTTTVTMPSNAAKATVYAYIYSVGYLVTDDYNLSSQSATPTVATPTFSPAAGTYTSAQSVTISDTTAGAQIRYTTDGTTPTASSTLYSGAISVTSTKTIKAIAIASGYTNSAVASAAYTINITPPQTENIIPNPSFETASGSLPANWQHDQWGTGLTATFTYNTTLGHTGTHSATLKVTQYGTEGDAKWDLIEPLAVIPGDNYTYTDWYQSDTTSRIVIEYNLTDGTQYYGELRNTSASPSVWKQYSQDLVIPYNAVSMRVYHMLSGIGTLTIDDASLTKTTAPVGFVRPIVTLTYDDGFEENISTVMPLLDEFGYKVTYCFATMFAEGVPSAEATIKDIASRGHEVCSHSVNHYDMTTLTAAQLDYELGHSQSYLQQLTGQQVRNYVSPYGTYNDFSLQYTKKYYRALRSTDEGYNSKTNFDQYRINVQNMTNTTTMAQYQSWVDQAIKDNSWLVLVYHRVASDPTQFDTPVADFRPQLQYLKDKAVTVKTLDQALSELEPQVGINDGYTATN